MSTALTTLIASDGSLPFKQLLRAAVKLSTWNRNSQIHLWIQCSSALLTGDLLKTAQDWCLTLTSKTAVLCRVWFPAKVICLDGSSNNPSKHKMLGNKHTHIYIPGSSEAPTDSGSCYNCMVQETSHWVVVFIMIVTRQKIWE